MGDSKKRGSKRRLIRNGKRHSKRNGKNCRLENDGFQTKVLKML